MDRRILLDDLIDQTSACMRDKLKLSLRTVYGESYGYMKVIRDYCLAHGEKYYNPILLNKFRQELESKYDRGEIKQGHYLGKRKCLERLTEYYNTGTLSWTMHKLMQKYRLLDKDKALLEEFMQTLYRDANTKYDYSWVIRRYLNYLRSTGITDVRTIKTSDLAGFILSCSKEVTRGSLRNILSYTKLFHEFLKDTGRLDIPFEGVFAVSVTREEKIQQPLTTEELNRILAQTDLTTVKGKRNLAIILLGAELGLRASDIICLRWPRFPCGYLCGRRNDDPCGRPHQIRQYQYKLLAGTLLRLWALELIFRKELSMTKLEKIDKELSKAREKAAEWQAKIRDLEKQRQEEENSMIVQAVRSLKLTPAELAEFFSNPGITASGQVGPKSDEAKEDTEHEE